MVQSSASAITVPTAATALAASATPTAINGGRLWQSLMDLAKLGATAKGGVRRLALTELDRAARDLVVEWLREAGCQIQVDAIGNIFAQRKDMAADPNADAVAIGSHIDTQPSGGRFDGTYGVLAGLEVIRSLNDTGSRTQRPVAVAIWTNEEGSRFTPVMMGSGVFAQAFSLAHCQLQQDRDGISVAQALHDIGYLGAAKAPRFAAYFEPHIEQGPVLERDACTIGVVEGALGQRWFDVLVSGQDAHAGPTPIDMRKDALLAAAKMVVQIRRIADQYPNYARATVGQLNVAPNSRNVIPGRVDFTIDLRNANDDTLNAMAADIQACAERIAQSDGVGIELKQVVYFPPCHFDVEQVNAIERFAKRRRYATQRLASGAGHDAVYVARTCPSAMIFIPCEGGISHNEIENAQPSDVEAGCNVLLDCVLAQAHSA